MEEPKTALEILFDQFSEDNRQAYHNGFVQGAITLHHLISQGTPLDEALNLCQAHKFLTTVD